MSFLEGTVIINKENDKLFRVLVQVDNHYVLAPQRIYGFAKDANEWIAVWNMNEKEYRIDTNNEFKNVHDYFKFENDDYKLSDEEFEVLKNTSERPEFVRGELKSNAILIGTFAELARLNKHILVKKIVSIALMHHDYQDQLLRSLEK